MRRRIVIAAARPRRAHGGRVVAAPLGRASRYYTGFVEGEERVLRSEVTGRVLEVAFGEGEHGAGERGRRAPRRRRDIAAKVASKRQELAVLDAEHPRARRSRSRSSETHLEARRLDARRAERARRPSPGATLADADATTRESELVKTGAQHGAAARRGARRGATRRGARSSARARCSRSAEARGGRASPSRAPARRAARAARARRAPARRARGAAREVRDPRARVGDRRADAVRSGRASSRSPARRSLAVLDPRDKYVQIYVPVADVDARARRPARRDRARQRARPARPGRGQLRRRPGELHAREDRDARATALGQVYRAKVRILEDVERFQPGTEGNVYLVDGTAALERGAPRRAVTTPRAERADATAPRDPPARAREALRRARALAGIDLELDGPQIVGVVGPDGAGKTTLLRSARRPARGRGRARRSCSASTCAAT